MKLSILYTHVTDSARYVDAATRFYKTYEQFTPKIPHELLICQCDQREHAPDIGAAFHYRGQAKDCGAYLHCAPKLACDWVLLCNAHVYFHRHGWLERFAEVAGLLAPGFWGPMASNEVTPHIRACCMLVRPIDLMGYPWKLTTESDANSLECGEGSFTRWMKEGGLPGRMVTWDGVYSEPYWRGPDHIFRRGDQSNCLVWDRHTDIYRDASPEEKLRLERAADGL